MDLYIIPFLYFLFCDIHAIYNSGIHYHFLPGTLFSMFSSRLVGIIIHRIELDSYIRNAIHYLRR